MLQTNTKEEMGEPSGLERPQRQNQHADISSVLDGSIKNFHYRVAWWCVDEIPTKVRKHPSGCSPCYVAISKYGCTKLRVTGFWQKSCGQFHALSFLLETRICCTHYLSIVSRGENTHAANCLIQSIYVFLTRN